MRTAYRVSGRIFVIVTSTFINMVICNLDHGRTPVYQNRSSSHFSFGDANVQNRSSVEKEKDGSPLHLYKSNSGEPTSYTLKDKSNVPQDEVLKSRRGYSHQSTRTRLILNDNITTVYSTNSFESELDRSSDSSTKNEQLFSTKNSHYKTLIRPPAMKTKEENYNHEIYGSNVRSLSNFKDHKPFRSKEDSKITSSLSQDPVVYKSLAYGTKDMMQESSLKSPVQIQSVNPSLKSMTESYLGSDQLFKIKSLDSLVRSQGLRNPPSRNLSSGMSSAKGIKSYENHIISPTFATKVQNDTPEDTVSISEALHDDDRLKLYANIEKGKWSKLSQEISGELSHSTQFSYDSSSLKDNKRQLEIPEVQVKSKSKDKERWPRSHVEDVWKISSTEYPNSIKFTNISETFSIGSSKRKRADKEFLQTITGTSEQMQIKLEEESHTQGSVSHSYTQTPEITEERSDENRTGQPLAISNVVETGLKNYDVTLNSTESYNEIEGLLDVGNSLQNNISEVSYYGTINLENSSMFGVPFDPYTNSTLFFYDEWNTSVSEDKSSEEGNEWVRNATDFNERSKNDFILDEYDITLLGHNTETDNASSYADIQMEERSEKSQESEDLIFDLESNINKQSLEPKPRILSRKEHSISLVLQRNSSEMFNETDLNIMNEETETGVDVEKTSSGIDILKNIFNKNLSSIIENRSNILENFGNFGGYNTGDKIPLDMFNSSILRLNMPSIVHGNKINENDTVKLLDVANQYDIDGTLDVSAVESDINQTDPSRNGTENLDSEVPWPVKMAAELPGDLILGGLMMVHEREDSITCGPIMPQGGIQALETMLYTLDVLNADPQILPNVTLGAHILDDCDKDTYGLEMAVDFIKASTLLAGVQILYIEVHLAYVITIEELSDSEMAALVSKAKNNGREDSSC